VPVTTRVLAAGLAAGAAALAAVSPALAAFNRVDKLDPILSGRGYVYYVKELDTAGAPIAGRTVTMTVGTVPGPGASVAPSDASGHTTGNAGQSTSVVSGPDGLAYFALHTSPTPGQNEFLWHDDDFTGQVLVQGLPHGVPSAFAAPVTVAPRSSAAPAVPSASASSAPSASAPTSSGTPRPQSSALAGAGAASAKGRNGGTGAGGGSGTPATLNAGAARAHLPGGSVPPIVAALVATGLVWMVLPRMLMRRLAVRPHLRARSGQVASGHAGLS
jgi:hypothetical protein